MYRWGGPVLLACCIAMGVWLRPAPSVVASSIYLQIEALNAGERVSLSIGVSNHCPPGAFVSFAACRLDKIAELSVGGKIVATIDASILTLAQQERLKETLQNLIDQSNNRLPQLQSIPTYERRAGFYPIREAAER